MINDSFTAGPAGIIVVTGATGFIGQSLVSRLRMRGHTVRRLVRSPKSALPGDFTWDPARGTLDSAALSGAIAVVHLAGESIAHRWTPERKAAIRESRVQGTALIARAIAALPGPKPVLLSGSAVGYYGDRGDEQLDETSAAGQGFLASVCVEWEGATQPASEAGARVVLLRSGIVLDANGGALKRLLAPFRLGAGGPIGSGRQWMSWIALEDHLRAMEHVLWTDTVHGPVNLVSPGPVTNAEFASTLGRALARPSLLHVPAFAMELLYGEMAQETILAGQRVMPRVLTGAGFHFSLPSLEQALRRAVGR